MYSTVEGSSGQGGKEKNNFVGRKGIKRNSREKQRRD